MKSILVALLIIIGQQSVVANEKPMVQLTYIGDESVLSDSEFSWIGLAIDDHFLAKNYENINEISANYSCIEVLEDIILCDFKTNLSGEDSRISLQYDRVTDDIFID